jgi:hypothetical protein
MKFHGKLAIVMLLFFPLGKVAAEDASKIPLVDVRQATILAFCAPTSKAAVADSDSNESLSDFKLYTGLVRQPLAKSGIRFQVLYAHSFRVRLGVTTTTFKPKADVGYYLIEPGKEPNVEYGVRTDTDLLLVAKRYFGSGNPIN